MDRHAAKCLALGVQTQKIDDLFLLAVEKRNEILPALAGGVQDIRLAAAVDDLGEVFLGNIVACQGEHIIVFHLRRHDFRITPLAEHTGELALDDAPLHALAEQAISGALRGVGDVFHCVCTPI